MSCEACSFPYSLCQCPATITVGELAILRIDLRTTKRALQLSEMKERQAHRKFDLAHGSLQEALQALEEEEARVVPLKRDLGAALRAYDAVVLSHREEVTRLHAELAQLRANIAASPVRVVTLTPVHCAVEDCDQEPDSTGFCERHRKATP